MKDHLHRLFPVSAAVLIVFSIGCSDDKFVADLSSTVADNAHSLTWMKCSVGQRAQGDGCDGDAVRLTWYEATDLVRQLEPDSSNPWRLPTPDELLSLVDCVQGRVQVNSVEMRCIVDVNSGRANIDYNTFPNTEAASYWSSVTRDDAIAWQVDFQSGEPAGHFRTTPNFVRLVRDQ